MSKVLARLQGGDRRSIGRADEVVQDVLREPNLFGEVFRGMWADSPLLRMRCTDVVEKVTAIHPELLQAYKQPLLKRVARVDQQEVRWHVAQMLPRLQLSREERALAVGILLGYLHDESRIVKTFAMQALADLAEKDPTLRPQVIGWLEQLTVTGSPAMASRGRKLLARLQRQH
ncbi:MAG: hypothetical protein FJ026_02205 [Chloroflexi bacterium]|nr:hypothetical protein [Chloroflexota bacterium]